MKFNKQMLKKLIISEMKSLNISCADNNSPDVDPEVKEVEADEFADTLVKQINFLDKLNIKEAKLYEELAAVAQQKNRVRKNILKN